MAKTHTKKAVDMRYGTPNLMCTRSAAIVQNMATMTTASQ